MMKTLAIASIALLGLTLSACSASDDSSPEPSVASDAGGDVVVDPNADAGSDAADEAAADAAEADVVDTDASDAAVPPADAAAE